MTFAYQLYLDTKCAHCGGSIIECRNPENEGAFEALDTTCYKRAAVEERTGAQNFKAEPGQLFYAAPIDDDLITGSGLTLTAHPDADEQGNETGESD